MMKSTDIDQKCYLQVAESLKAHTGAADAAHGKTELTQPGNTG